MAPRSDGAPDAPRAPRQPRGGFVRWFYGLVRTLGAGAMAVAGWIISSVYFVIYPRRLRNSLRFYHAVYPDRGRWFRLARAWRQYKSFAALFAERLALERGGEIPFESEGWEHLERAHRDHTGGIIVMSHMGNWEVAARLFQRRALRMMIYMGARQKEQLERQQKEDLQAERIKIVAVEAGGESMLGGLEGLKWVKEGGFVAMTGDMLWTREQRALEVTFFGRPVRLPQAPFAFALLTRAPLFVFFSLRTRKRNYRISITPPRVLQARRAGRQQAMQRAAQEYADLLEQKVREHPHQWYHFEPFF